MFLLSLQYNQSASSNGLPTILPKDPRISPEELGGVVMTEQDIWDLNTAYNCPNLPPKPVCKPPVPSLLPRTALGSDAPCVIIRSSEHPRPMTGSFENYWDFMVCHVITIIKYIELSQSSAEQFLLSGAAECRFIGKNWCWPLDADNLAPKPSAAC